MSGLLSGISSLLDRVGNALSSSPYTFDQPEGDFASTLADARSAAQPNSGVILAAGEPEPDEEDERVEGRPLTMQESYNSTVYHNDYRELQRIDPNNAEFGPTLRPQGWVPSDADVQRISGELAAARARQANGGKPSYVVGASDGGPGQWVANSPKYPFSQPDAAAYQSRVTGAPPGMEYSVPVPGRPSGRMYFDGYDPSTNSLIDAKMWNNYPPDFKIDDEVKLIVAERTIAQNNGASLEVRVSSQATVDSLEAALKEAGYGDVKVVWVP